MEHTNTLELKEKVHTELGHIKLEHTIRVQKLGHNVLEQKWLRHIILKYWDQKSYGSESK